MQLYEPDGEGGWKEFEKIPFEDTLTTSTIGFDKTGKILYMTDSRDRDTAALAEINLADDEEKVLAANDKADVGGVLVHPTEKNIQAVSFDYEKTEWHVLDPAIQQDFDYLKTVADGELQVASRTLDDKKWIVAYLVDDGPTNYYLYDRPTPSRRRSCSPTARRSKACRWPRCIRWSSSRATAWRWSTI